MELKDYYEVLGSDPDASAEDLKKAYREIAAKLHPDLASPRLKKWAEQQMKLVNQAYEVLGNPRKRAQYDTDRQRASFRTSQAYGQTPNRSPSILSVPLVRTIVTTLAILVGFALFSTLLRAMVWNPRGIGTAILIVGAWIAVSWLRRRNRRAG